MKNQTVHLPLALALLALATTGCITPVLVDGGGSESDSSYRTMSRETALKVALDVSAADGESMSLAHGVKTTARTALRDAKYQIVENGASSDLALSLAVSQTVFNNAADKFFALDGEVDANLSDPATGNILATKTIAGRSEQSLGMEKAVKSLEGKIKAPLREWIRTSVTPDQVSLAASLVRVTSIDRHNGGDAGFVADFVSAVSGIKGVLRCETAGVDTAAHVATFRVLWRSDGIPEGLLPAIANAVPGIKF